jgi:hypothetical protein
VVAETIAALDPVYVAVAASLAMLAALSAAAVGYRRRMQPHSSRRTTTLPPDRSTANEELRSRLQAIEVRLRELEVRDDEFDRRVQDLDAYVLTSESFLGHGVRALFETYLDCAREASRIVRSFPELDSEDTQITGPSDIPAAAIQRLHGVLTRAEETRAEIMKDVQEDR